MSSTTKCVALPGSGDWFRITTEKGLKICRAFKFQNIADIRSKQYDKILKAAS